MIIGKTRTNQPVESDAGFDEQVINDMNDIDNYEELTKEWNGTLNTTTLADLTITNSFCKCVRNFKELQFIFNVRLSNNTESNITITSDKILCQFNDIPSNIKSKIYNHAGEPAGNGSIAYCDLFISRTTGTADNTQMPRYCNLYCYPDNISMFLEGGNIVIPAGESRDFEGRISLAI